MNENIALAVETPAMKLSEAMANLMETNCETSSRDTMLGITYSSDAH
jgi:hypothetical protein